MKARITGTGSYAPSRIMTNAELERMVATSDEWIRERTGIRERHIAASGEACSDLAVQAGRRALEAADQAERNAQQVSLFGAPGESGTMDVMMQALIETPRWNEAQRLIGAVTVDDVIVKNLVI